MDKASFTNLVGKLYLYFRYSKLPTNEQLDLWFNDCSFVPSVALDWIYEQFKKGDGLPRNFPTEFTKMWYAYRKANPDKSITDYEYCNDCFGNGTHMFMGLNYDYNPPIKISYVAACAACDNYKKQFGGVIMNGGKTFIEGKPLGGFVPKVWRTTKQEIINNGFTYLSQSDPKEEKIVLKSTYELIDGVLKEIPKPENREQKIAELREQASGMLRGS